MCNKYKEYENQLDVVDPDAVRLFSNKKEYQKIFPEAYQEGFLEYCKSLVDNPKVRVSSRESCNITHFYKQLIKGIRNEKI